MFLLAFACVYIYDLSLGAFYFLVKLLFSILFIEKVHSLP